MVPPVANGSSSEERRKEIEVSVPQVPVTEQRRPYVYYGDNHKLKQAGVARANIAASKEVPNGTQKCNWFKKHSHQTVLQQHVDFFDHDKDGVIWPLDTFRSFHAIGFNVIFSFFALLLIHVGFSYVSLPPGHYLPDPFLRIFTAQIHKCKHGSDSGTYDNEGRFIAQKFEDVFAKYAGSGDGEKDGLTLKEALTLVSGQKLAADPFGWSAATFEWIATYLLLWPEDGKMKKDDIRRIYDGSIFYEMAAKRASQK